MKKKIQVICTMLIKLFCSISWCQIKQCPLKEDSCKGGKKSKQRLTILLCWNKTRTDKLKPLIIGKYRKPRYFKNVNCLLVHYKANKRAWMIAEIFNNWVLNVVKKMKNKNNIALIVDNSTPDNNLPCLKNITVFYFSPNCTSILQPLDLGIIKCFKGFIKKG